MCILLTWKMLLYHITVVIIDLTCPAILGPYHSGGFEANLKLHPAVFSFNICLALGKLPFFVFIRLETRNNQRELETSQSSSLLMVQFILDGSGAPQCPCHTLVAGSVSIHSCSILSMLIFQAQIRVAHWFQQKTDG